MRTLIPIMDNRRAPEFPWLARLLQANDTAFPSGGYAHSYGFEQIVRFGQVHDAETMILHLDRHVWPMLIHFELPVVRFAQEAALQGDDSGLLALDACVDATKTARELREASRATGRRRLQVFGETGASTVLTAFARAVDEGRSHGHHAVVYGMGLAAVPQRALLTSWAFQTLSAVCLSAPKLLRIGQDAVQRMLAASLERTEEYVTLALAVDREALGWFDPLMEIASMQHEIAHERLFIS
jgi:urease accessory protein